MTEEDIFHEALARSLPEARAAYLEQACAGNPGLRAGVEALLRANVGATGFLDAPNPALAATVDQPLSERPGTVIGPYKLLEQIGEGGFGVVFMAEQTQPVRRKVALKVLKPGMDTRQVVARFEAERQALAIMDHPNIARVLDGGQTSSGRPYFVMDLVKGLPITDYCDQAQLAPRERLELFVHLCQAVQHAHQKGIIHRDLKPSNVLVTLHDGTPLVKVIDFGIAKALGQSLTDKTLFTGFAQMVGTPLYMSPEQAALSNADVDTRSDVYALGVLLYELLTGTTPFDKERFKHASYDEIRRIICEEEPARPSTQVNTLAQTATTVTANRRSDPRKLSRLFKGELDWIVMKALEKDRNRRYESASAFSADVQHHLYDEPVLACAPSAGYRLRKFVQRNKAPVLAVSLVVLALIAGIIGTTVGLLQAERAKQEAEARAAETRAVLDFVENKIFAAARPEGQDGGLGREVTLRHAIDAALPFVEKSFTDQPLIEARLRMTLGVSLLDLGEAKRAEEQFEKARSIRTKHLGPDHPDTLTSMDGLAMSYGGLGQFAEALELHEQTLALRKAKLGPDHPETLTSMSHLASSYSDVGRHTDALRLHEETLALQRDRLGPNHPDTLTSLNNLAGSYHRLGSHAEAVKLRQQTLAIRKTELGPDHPDTLNSMYNLALSYHTFRRYADSLELHERALALRKAKLGLDHPLHAPEHVGRSRNPPQARARRGGDTDYR
jgi:serine/threonine protein kinase